MNKSSFHFTYLELIVDSSNSIAEVFSSDSSDFNFLEFEKLFGRLKEFSDDDQSVNETIVSFEDLKESMESL
jgi:hypothetical protein